MTTKTQVLKEMRLDKRLTQAEVAERLNVSQSYYSAIERGEKLGEVADAMQVINRMRLRGDRTEGGENKAGRKKG